MPYEALWAAIILDRLGNANLAGGKQNMRATSVKIIRRRGISITTLLAVSLLASKALAHGNVAPQAVDTTGLPELGSEWVETNPFRENAEYRDIAIEIGASAYNQNCARCHGLEAVSG